MYSGIDKLQSIQKTGAWYTVSCSQKFIGLSSLRRDYKAQTLQAVTAILYARTVGCKYGYNQSFPLILTCFL